MRVYYNEFDPFAAQWLRNLIDAGHLPAGDVDERDLRDVCPDDVRGYTQAHFFAGIGGWPLALRLAGWPNDRPVWTGSCPCQPFSAAGKRKGEADERHVWPVWRVLIGKCKPSVCFGEQVASKDGRRWLGRVLCDLEDMAYRVAAADLCAAGVGAPHQRQRLWFVADAPHTDGRPGECGAQAGVGPGGQCRERLGGCGDGRVGHADGPRPQVYGHRDYLRNEGAPRSTGSHDPWAAAGSIWCDERALGRGWVARRVEPGTFPLAHGVPGRVGRLRGYGNAIVPQVAAEFVGTFMEAT